MRRRQTGFGVSTTLLMVMVIGACAIGCRGNKSPDPPVHLQQNMDFQRRYEAQEQNDFFADHREMRQPVEHTIARGEFRGNRHFRTGKIGGKFAETPPMRITTQILKRGQDRYGIYCVVCHGGTGDGQSMLMTRKMAVAPPSYTEERLLKEPLGYFFDVISNGVRNMPAYGAQIPTADRWAIAAYVRALQVAGSASIAHVPKSIATQKGWGKAQ